MAAHAHGHWKRRLASVARWSHIYISMLSCALVLFFALTDGGPLQVIQPGKTWSPSFKVTNNAGTYWSHPPAHETTQRHLTMGAGGLISIQDPVEAALPLPRESGVDNLPLVLTSRRFHLDDQFASDGDHDKDGDYAFANGTLDAEVALPAQFVRLRILNAEIERGYDLGFSDGRSFHVITTDGCVHRSLPHVESRGRRVDGAVHGRRGQAVGDGVRRADAGGCAASRGTDFQSVSGTVPRKGDAISSRPFQVTD